MELNSITHCLSFTHADNVSRLVQEMFGGDKDVVCTCCKSTDQRFTNMRNRLQSSLTYVMGMAQPGRRIASRPPQRQQPVYVDGRSTGQRRGRLLRQSTTGVNRYEARVGGRLQPLYVR